MDRRLALKSVMAFFGGYIQSPSSNVITMKLPLALEPTKEMTFNFGAIERVTFRKGDQSVTIEINELIEALKVSA